MRAEVEVLNGERTFCHATQVEENLNMDEVYDAMDHFSSASKMAFEHDDMELEARCEAWLGKLYNNSLKKESKAMTHFNNMIRLSNALKPKDITKESWFTAAQSELKAIQEKRQLEEEAAKDKADAPFREMIKDDLAKISAEKKKDCATFLKFINENYMPGGKKFTLTDEQLKSDKIKSSLKKFFIKFHPDKQVNEPRQIQILREEIMRVLNTWNESLK